MSTLDTSNQTLNSLHGDHAPFSFADFLASAGRITTTLFRNCVFPSNVGQQALQVAETIFNRTNRGDTDKLAATYFLVAEGEKLQLAVLTP